MSALARALRAYANRPPRIVFHAARSLARRPDETDSHGHLAAATGSSGGNSSLSSGQTRPLAARLGWPSRRAGNRFQLDSRSNPPPPPTPFAALAAAAAARSAGRSACSDKSGQEAASARDEAQVERAHLGPSTWRDVCFNRANRIGSDRIDACARGEVSRAEAIKGNFSALPPHSSGPFSACGRLAAAEPLSRRPEWRSAPLQRSASRPPTPLGGGGDN